MLVRALLAFSLLTTACGQTGPQDSAQAQAQREYTGQGTVRGIEGRRITIEHGDIAGYMPAMTMPFDLAQGVSLDGIAVGARIEFRFHPESGGRHVVTSIRKL